MLGPGVAKADPERMIAVLAAIDQLRRRFPGVPVSSIDVQDLNSDIVGGIAFDQQIIFNEHFLGPGAGFQDRSLIDRVVTYRSPENLATHEFGHLVDQALSGPAHRRTALGRSYRAWRRAANAATERISPYAAFSEYENVAELFGVAFGPPEEYRHFAAAAHLRLLLQDGF